MEQLGHRPAYVGTSAALAAMHTGSAEVVIDQVVLPTGQRATRVRLLSELPAARRAVVQPRWTTPQPWYRRWSPAQVAGLIVGILAVLVGLGWALWYAVTSLIAEAAPHAGKALGIAIVILIILGAIGGGGGRTFSGTFRGTIR